MMTIDEWVKMNLERLQKEAAMHPASFEEELKDLIDRWEGLLGTTKEDMINAMMDAIEELAPDAA